MNIDDEFTKIKNLLFEAHLSDEPDNKFFELIANMQDVSPEIKDLLIKMHIKYLTDIQGMKKYQFRTMTDLTDAQKEIFKHIVNVQNNNGIALAKLNTTTPNKNNKLGILNKIPWTNIFIGAGIFSLFVIIVFVMFLVDAEAARGTKDFLGELMNSYKSGGGK